MSWSKRNYQTNQLFKRNKNVLKIFPFLQKKPKYEKDFFNNILNQTKRETTMPIYEYTCPECGKEIEIIQRVGDKAPVCEKCGIKLGKIISKNSFILKGDGWGFSCYSKKPKGKTKDHVRSRRKT